jgi:hypothetical protein
VTKKSILPLLVAFLEENLADEPETPTLVPELKRIANALERIAASLEKLAPISPTAPLQNGRAKTETKVVTTQQNTTNPPAISPALKVATTQQNTTNTPQNGATPHITKAANPQQNPAAKPQNGAANPSVLIKYLTERDIKWNIAYTNNNPKLEDMAIYLGQNYAVCAELYQLLKGNLKTPQENFSYTPKETQRTIIRQTGGGIQTSEVS